MISVFIKVTGPQTQNLSPRKKKTHHLRHQKTALQVGENCFEDESEWQQIMEDHTPRDQDRQEMAHEARDRELAKATVEGGVFMVLCLHSSMTKSAEQARAFGKALLLWCAQRSTESRILPDSMVAPEERTTEQLQEIAGCWLQHGELSTVCGSAPEGALYLDIKWKKADRSEQNPPWVGYLGPLKCEHAKRRKAGKTGGSDGTGV
jgi:hypothetical protein